MTRFPFYVILICSAWPRPFDGSRHGAAAFAPATQPRPRQHACHRKQPRSNPPSHSLQAFNNNKWNRDIEEKSRRRAGGGGGETLAGAVLGGLLAGPFGAIFGASIGSSIGAKNAVDRARQEEMAKLGIDSSMLEAAQEVAEALERANEGLTTVQDSLSSLQRFAKRLDGESNMLMESAKSAVATGDEEKARNILLERQATLDKLKKTLKDCVEMKNRLETMERNVAVLETKALEIETLLQRTVGAKAIQDVNNLGLSLNDEDPLLRKFRDLGID